MSIVLIGYRGSGKTTIGRKLADRLWWKFVDSDEQIVQRAGKTIKSIFNDQGEPAFRDLESAVVKDLAKLSDHVISLGGGAMLRAENRTAMRVGENKIVYLRCDPDVLLQRIQTDTATAENRPTLTTHAGSIDEVKQLLSVREPIYRETMTAELDVTNLTPDEAVVYITRLV